jgi:hypothetical protein
MNIKIGDKVIAPSYMNDSYKIRIVKEIRIKTISVGDEGEFREYMIEPKQKPINWKVYDENKANQMRTIKEQIDTLRKQLTEIYASLETVNIDTVENK